MSLARLYGRYRAQLRADFREFYGVSFDRAARESPIEASDLAALLPRGSRTLTEINPEYGWTQEDYLLANMANSLNLLVWAQTEDGQKNRNRPKPIQPPKQHPKDRVSYTTDEYAELLSRPRKEV